MEWQSESRLDLCLFEVHLIFNRKSRISVDDAAVEKQTTGKLRLSLARFLIFPLFLLGCLQLFLFFMHLLKNLKFVFEYLVLLLVSVELSFNTAEMEFDVFIGSSPSDRTD